MSHYHSSSKHSFAALMGSAAILLGSQIQPTVAQTAASNEDAAILGTIVLQAEGTQAAGTFQTGAAKLAESPVEAVGVAVRNIPGVSVARSDSPLSYGVTIRGIGGTSVDAADPKLIYMVDGVSTQGGTAYRNATSQIVDPALLKNVSVSVGTLASLEYGSGLAGGAVNMETIDAHDITKGELGFKGRQVLGANSNGQGWLTSTTLAWAPNEQFDLLVNYTRRQRGIQKDGDGKLIESNTGFNFPSFLVKASYHFGEGNAHRVSFSHLKSESSEDRVPLSQMTVALPMVFGLYDRYREGHITSVSYGYNPADNQLIDFEAVLSASRQDFRLDLVQPGFVGTAFSGPFATKQDKIALKNTARFTTGVISHTLLAGIEASTFERDLPMSGVAFSGKARRTGIFAIDKMDFGNDLTMTSGVRIERQKLSEMRFTQTIGVQDMSATARSGGIGLEKGFGNGFTGYGSFSYGEGLAALNEAGNTQGGTGSLYGDFTAQSRSWKAGVRYVGQGVLEGDDALSASLGLFNTAIWNDNSSVMTTAAPQRETNGFTASAHYSLASGLYSSAGVTVFTKSSQYSISQGWKDYHYTPTDQANLTLGHKFGNGLDLSWTLRAGKALDLASSSGNLKAPGWGTSDVMASYTVQSGNLEGLRVDLGVNNLFDKKYALEFATGSTQTFQETGRNVHLTLAKTF